MTELRRDPITGQWAVIVPGRSARPNEHAAIAPAASSAPDCPFCEGNESRTPPEVAAVGPPGRGANERGWWVRTIPNRFPTVVADPPEPEDGGARGEFESQKGFGYHEVIIETPHHVPLLPFLPTEQVRHVVRMCRDRVRELSERPGVGSVTLFENAGPESGGSLWHPHSQLVATHGLSPSLREELEGAARYLRAAGGDCAFEQVGNAEVRLGTRLLLASRDLMAYTPFASSYPFEVRVLPSHHARSFAEATDSEVEALSETLPRLLRAFLEVAPGASYNLVVRSPVEATPTSERYHWHLDILPRLVRPDGFDLGSGFHVNPVSPEWAAESLRTALGAKL